MSGSTYDVIVAGVGGMGSAACHHLARAGAKVLGLERFDIGHAQGSSHGLNRIIRLAYFEHPDYVPFLRRAYELWRDLEAQWDERILFVTGSVDSGPPDSRIVTGSIETCRAHGLAHEVLTARQLEARAPGWCLPDHHMAVLQPEGGFVASERAIAAHVTLALAAGADIRGREAIVDWSPIAGGGVRVRTARGSYEAGALVLSTGAWIGDHVPALEAVAVPERQVLGWFAPKDPSAFALDRFPVGNMLTDHGHFYVFPQWGAPGFKIGLYHHLREEGHADALSREPNAADEAALRAALTHYFPLADGPTLRLGACLFTNTPDEHFIIDRLPDCTDVIVASPCSGHGFKFASVMGEVLADLALGRTPQFDLSLFSLQRFA